ncbi:MAG: hypothetical protein DMF69_11585 [Acidobacteria bacterium]|nr:MAG: hypothetical protein DMF69_11585 [Acidobacteriota bacterium]
MWLRIQKASQPIIAIGMPEGQSGESGSNKDGVGHPLPLFLDVSERSGNFLFACTNSQTTSTDLIRLLRFEIANSNPNFEH